MAKTDETKRNIKAMNMPDDSQYVRNRVNELLTDGWSIIKEKTLPLYLVSPNEKVVNTDIASERLKHPVKNVYTYNTAYTIIRNDLDLTEDENDKDYRRKIYTVINNNWDKMTKKFPIEISDWFTVFYEIYPDYEDLDKTLITTEELARLFTDLYTLNAGTNLNYGKFAFANLLPIWRVKYHKKLSDAFIDKCLKDIKLRNYVLNGQLSKVPGYNTHIITQAKLISIISKASKGGVQMEKYNVYFEQQLLDTVKAVSKEEAIKKVVKMHPTVKTTDLKAIPV